MRRHSRKAQTIDRSLTPVSSGTSPQADAKSQPTPARRPLFELPTPPAPPIAETVSSSRRHLNPNAIRTFDELTTAISTHRVQVTLAADIIVPRSILIDSDLALNLNGHSLISDETVPDIRVLDIRRGEVTLIGPGKIFAMGPQGSCIRVFGAISSGVPGYTTLKVTEDIHLYAPEGCGVLVAANLGAAYGVSVDFGGEIIARSGICLARAIRGHGSTIPFLRVRDGASIIADEVSGSAIEAGGLARWQIGAAKLFGRSGLSATVGQFQLAHTQVVATESSLEFAAEGLGRESLDAAEPEPTPAPRRSRRANTPSHIRVHITDGTFVSETGLAIFGNPEQIAELAIENAGLHGAYGAMNRELTKVAHIQGGEFGTDVEYYLPSALVPESPAPEVIVDDGPRRHLVPRPEVIPEPAATTAPETSTAETSMAETSQPEQTSQPELSEPITPDPNEESAPAPEIVDAVESADAPVTPAVDRSALESALRQALDSMRGLGSDGTISGFDKFKAKLLSTDALLADSSADLTSIRDAASDLLSALDSLEPVDDSTLTDEELDQLFYHGALLEAAAGLDAIDDDISTAEEDADDMALDMNLDDLDLTEDEISQPLVQKDPLDPIDELDSADETPVEPELAGIFAALDRVGSDDDTYDDYDETEVEDEPIEFADFIVTDRETSSDDQFALAEDEYQASGALDFIDESAPSDSWSTGVTLIDESSPLDPKVVSHSRAVKRRSSGASRFFQSFSAGLHAGVAAFRDSQTT